MVAVKFLATLAGIVAGTVRSRCLAPPSMIFIALVLSGCDSGGNKGDGEGAAETAEPTTSEMVDIEGIRRLIDAGDTRSAETALKSYLGKNRDDAEGLELAGDLAIRAGDLGTAASFFEAAIRAAGPGSKSLRLKQADVLLREVRPFDAIDSLTQAVKAHPEAVELRQNLASVMAQVGLQDQAAEHLQWMVQRKYGSQSVLLMLSDLTRPQTVEAMCRSALSKHPDDPRPNYSLALREVTYSNWNDVEEILREVLERRPDFSPAVALYGRALVEMGDASAIERWSQSLPDDIEDYSQYWIAAGNWALRQQRFEQAANAFAMAVKCDENDPESLAQLSIALTRLKRNDEAERAADRARKLAALRGQIDTLGTWRFNSQKGVVDLALTLDDLGRRWEAVNWMMLGYSMSQHPDERFGETFTRLRSKLTGSTPWQLPEASVADMFEIEDAPAVTWIPSDSSVVEDSVGDELHTIRFIDEAAKRLLDHTCEISAAEPGQSGLMIYQSGAGGAGVLDYDLDGWPDLMLTNMDGTPGKDDSKPNRVFKNFEGSFRDVTAETQLIDPGYSQGIAVGDFNSDGWPDVLVGNIGANRLYQNNGDGTYRDVTVEAGLSGSGWTTSVAITDLNGDGHADLYEVGYCRGEAPLRERCIEPEIGEARSCNPLAFDAEPDRIWAGNGDGTFSDRSDWLGDHEPGRGFALVVGDFDHQVGLETYVANDMTANHYWANAAGTNTFALADQAPIRGLAFNRRSIAQASMGIAAADADSDGDVDFLLTHFSDDHNTYYEQYGPGTWADESQRAGFIEPSKPMLAYGTQWIDADNDGRLEAFIANGDIDDFSFEGRRYKQLPQLMRQVRRAHWGVIDAELLGDYFTRATLARSVVSLDADRDGRTDLLVTHLFDPVALLINDSRSDGRQVRFFVRASKSHRDGIGTRVRFRCGDRSFQQQRIGGSGFQCSNEACVVFGVGDALQIEDLEIVWPNGDVETIGKLDLGSDFLAVQGAGVMAID